MLIKVLDRFVMGDGIGEEFDIGELMTYLNDDLLLAPSMLLVPQVSWSAVDAGSFDVALTDHERTVSGRVFVDERGAPRDFMSALRSAIQSDNRRRRSASAFKDRSASHRSVDRIRDFALMPRPCVFLDCDRFQPRSGPAAARRAGQSQAVACAA